MFDSDYSDKQLIMIHNNVNQLEVKNQHLLNLMLWGINKLRDKGESEVKISFDEVKQVAELPEYIRPSQFQKFIDEFKENLGGSLKVNIISPDGKIINGNIAIFTSIFTVGDEEALYLSINPKLMYLNNHLKQNYFAFHAGDYWGKATTASQRLFLLLSEYRMLGRRIFLKKDLVERLNMPKSYSPYKIRTQILDPAIKELSKDFPELKYEEGKRGNTVNKYLFTWSVSAQKKIKSKEIKNKKNKITQGDINNIINTNYTEEELKALENKQNFELTQEQQIQLWLYKNNK